MTNSAVEAKLLKTIADNDPEEWGLVRMFDSFRFRSHYVIVFELLGPNLFNWSRGRKIQSDKLKTIAR